MSFAHERKIKWIGFSSLLFALSLTGCGEAPKPVAAPAPAVSVFSVHNSSIGEHRKFVARTEAFKEANITARVQGELIERSFYEGDLVEENQVLFTIDPAAYKASLTQAKANLKSKKAAALTAAANLDRGTNLAKTGYISASDLDKLTSEASQTSAAVSSAEAALEKAELDLSYTIIKAPFAGSIGKANYDTGNIIDPASGTLATVTITNPIYVNFQITEADYVSYIQKHARRTHDDEGAFDMSLILPNNTKFPYLGKIDFADTKIDQGTGTVNLRATFENAEGVIIPGLFVTLTLESKLKENQVLLPQVAVQESQQGKFVLVVNEQNLVEQRIVELGRRIDAMWVVQSGLNEGERVIIEGLQKVRMGNAVMPTEKTVNPETGAVSDLVQ